MTAVSLLPRSGARIEAYQRVVFEQEEAPAALCVISV
jgi:hypothetical protein